MSDSHTPDLSADASGAWDPEDPLLDALILDALIEEEEALRSSPGIAEPLRKAGLGEDLGVAEAEAGTALNPAVKAAALAAFDAEGRMISQPQREPLRARRLEPLLTRRTWLAAAAMLLLTLTAGIFFSASEPEAEAGIQLTALKRLNRAGSAGMSKVEPRYFAPLGRVFSPAADQWISFAFAPDALLVVGAGDAVRVARSDWAARLTTQLPAAVQMHGAVPGAGAATLLRLESGEARLATRGEAIAVEVASAGVLVLLEGAAHVAVTAEGATGMPVVALADASEACFYRKDGTAIPLAGPGRVLLSAQGAQAFGTAARSLFRELAFFGGPLPEPTQERRVSARLWQARVLPGATVPAGAKPLKGAVRRRRADFQLLTARADVPVGMRLSWRPELILSDARLLRVALRAPADTTVTLRHAGADGADLIRTVDAAPAGASSLGSGLSASGPLEPGIATLEIPLSAGWRKRLTDGKMELLIRVPAQTHGPEQGPDSGRRPKIVRATFDGVVLVLGPSENGLPRSMPPQGTTQGDRHD